MNRHAAPKCIQHDAIAFGIFEQALGSVRATIVFDGHVDGAFDPREANRNLA